MLEKTTGEYLENNSVVNRFEQVAQKHPKNIAILGEGFLLDYQTLEMQSRTIAGLLLSMSLTSNSRILLVGSVSKNMVVALLATLRAGCIAVPFDASMGLHYGQMIAEDCSPDCVIYCDDILKLDQPKEILEINLPSFLSDNAELIDQSILESSRPVIDGHAYIFYTSGTTSKPKGILGLHQSLAHFIQWQRNTFAVLPSDRIAQLTSPSFDVYLRDVFLALTSGAGLIIPSPNDQLPQNIFRWMDNHSITIVHSVPSILTLWLSCATKNQHLSSIRYYFSAGEALSWSLVSRWKSTFPETGSFINFYGPTETTLAKFYYRVPEQFNGNILPVGQAHPGSSVEIIGSNKAILPQGHIGEIVIHTNYGTAGYINRTKETMKNFEFFSKPGALKYLTGDLGYINPDGHLVVLGRKDRQVKINGVRIEPEGISVVLQGCNLVENAVVVAKKDERDKNFLIAYWVPKNQNPDIELSMIKQYMQSKLPSTHQPSVYVKVNTIPITNRGKIDFPKLPAFRRSESFDINLENVNNTISRTPRLADGAIQYLEKLFSVHQNNNLKVLEFGMGGSTLWFADRTTALVSIENDSLWFERIKNQLSGHSAQLRLIDLPIDRVCSDYQPESFDLILVDNEDFDEGKMRVKCFTESIILLKPGGTIMFDNVDRPKFSAIFTIMADKNWEMNISTNLYAKEGYNAGSQTVWWIKPRQATEIVTDNPQNKLESLDSLEPSEQWLAIWRKVLNMEVTLTDRLQDLGADSIDIVEIDHWGSHLISNPSLLYQNPSITDLLAYEKNRPEDIDKSIVHENSYVNFPLLPTQVDILAIPLSNSFISPTRAYFINKSVPLDKINQVTLSMFRTFPVLRTAFSLAISPKTQFIRELKTTETLVKEFRLKGTTQSECHKELTLFIDNHSSFDLEKDTLFKIYYFHTDCFQENVVLFISHHILLDGLSQHTIHKYFVASIKNNAQPNDQIDIQTYMDALIRWAKYLNQLAQSDEILKMNLSYWQELSRHQLPPSLTKKPSGLYRSILQINANTTYLIKNNYRDICSFQELLILAIVDQIHKKFEMDYICAEWVTSGRINDADIDLLRSPGCFYRTYPLLLTANKELDINGKVRSLRHELAVAKEQELRYSCRRWLNNIEEDQAIWSKINPMFTFNFQATDDQKYDLAKSGELTPINQPDYLWNRSTQVLSEQIAIPLRFFFNMENGYLQGYILGQCSFIAQNDLDEMASGIISSIRPGDININES